MQLQPTAEVKQNDAIHVLSKPYIKSPMNWIGNKYKMLKQILPLFPQNINNFVDLFAGGCDVGINVKANKVYFNDSMFQVIDMYKALIAYGLEATLDHIELRKKQFGLSTVNKQGFLAFREFYNQEKNPLDLFVLKGFAFNSLIKFNLRKEYSETFAFNRPYFNASNLHNTRLFINKLQNMQLEFSAHSFENFDFSNLTNEDFVYCDPPYFITAADYNKRWQEVNEKTLLFLLDSLNKQKVKFALQNVLHHNNLTNTILAQWLNANPQYTITNIKTNYSNCIHGKKNKINNTVEILVTNYDPVANYALVD